MNTSQIQCFLTIADTLNFARAAEQLHITQPAVTQQLHALEKELGVRLFHRSTHSVRLTDEGMLFLPDARQIAAVSDPSQVPPDVHHQQEALLGDRMPAELYFCDTVEAVAVLTAAGYGVSVLPSVLVPALPGLRQIPLEGGQPVSFGFYYKSWKDRPLLKAFITCAQQTLNPKKP